MAKVIPIRKRIPARPLVPGKGLALAVDLGDASKANRRNPKCPSENAATITKGRGRSGEPLAQFIKLWTTGAKEITRK